MASGSGSETESPTVSRERRRVVLACKEMASLLTDLVDTRFQALDEKLDLVLGGMALFLGSDWQKMSESHDLQPDAERSPACSTPPGLQLDEVSPRCIVFDMTEDDNDEALAEYKPANAASEDHIQTISFKKFDDEELFRTTIDSRVAKSDWQNYPPT